jgi:excisionase family DNA binding protein
MITPDTSLGLLTVAEAAAALRISKPTIWRWIREGRLHPVRLGRRVVRLRRVEIDGLSMKMAKDTALANNDPWAKYIIPSGDPTIDPAQVMAELNAINDKILARRGGVPFESSLPLIHEARRERDEQL